MNGRAICEAYARHKGVPEAEVGAWAEAFWNLSPRGDLRHVFVAMDELKEAGVI